MTKQSYDAMSVEKLTALSQKMGRDADAIQAERVRIKAAIDAKLPKIEHAQNGAVAYVQPDKPEATTRARK